MTVGSPQPRLSALPPASGQRRTGLANQTEDECDARESDQTLQAASESLRPRPDGFQASAELAESQRVEPGKEIKANQEVRKRTQRVRTQAVRNRVGQPRSLESRGGAANVQAPRSPLPASATKQVPQTGLGQTQLGERKRPRQVDRAAYISRLQETLGSS